MRGQRATSQREEEKKCERVSREEATLYQNLVRRSTESEKECERRREGER